jgi:hypothetical protein
MNVKIGIKMVERLSECARLNEFNEFIGKVEVDVDSGGRKFVYVDGKGEKHSYSMNQIVNRFEHCVKQSIQNPVLRDTAINRLAKLNRQANDHVAAKGSFASLRRDVGNLWYKIFHWNFDKDDSFNAIRGGQTKGRDLAINTLDEYGRSPLHRLLGNVKSEKELSRDVKEMIDNGADVWLAGEGAMNAVEYSLYFAERQNDLDPLKAVFSSMKPEDLVEAVQKFYTKNLNHETKLVLVQIVHSRLKNCVKVLGGMERINQDDFLKDYLYYAIDSDSDSMMDLSVTDRYGTEFKDYIKDFYPRIYERSNRLYKNGNTPLHHLITDEIEITKKAKELLYNGADITIKNEDGLNPLELAFARAAITTQKKPLENLLSLVSDDAIIQLLDKELPNYCNAKETRDLVCEAFYLRDSDHPDIPKYARDAYMNYLLENPQLPLGPNTIKWVKTTFKDPEFILDGRPKK